MSKSSSAWLAPVYLASIISLTLVALIIVVVFDVRGSAGLAEGSLFVLVFGTISVADLLLARFVGLPDLVKRPGATQKNATVLGYSFAVAPAIFGIAASVLTGQALLALPFGAFALLSWAVVRQFLQESYSDERRSRLGEQRR